MGFGSSLDVNLATVVSVRIVLLYTADVSL